MQRRITKQNPKDNNDDDDNNNNNDDNDNNNYLIPICTRRKMLRTHLHDAGFPFSDSRYSDPRPELRSGRFRRLVDCLETGGGGRGGEGGGGVDDTATNGATYGRGGWAAGGDEGGGGIDDPTTYAATYAATCAAVDDGCFHDAAMTVVATGFIVATFEAVVLRVRVVSCTASASIGLAMASAVSFVSLSHASFVVVIVVFFVVVVLLVV